MFIYLNKFNVQQFRLIFNKKKIILDML